MVCVFCDGDMSWIITVTGITIVPMRKFLNPYGDFSLAVKCLWTRHRVLEVDMKRSILKLYVSSRCGGSAFLVFYIKKLEAATNDRLDLLL